MAWLPAGTAYSGCSSPRPALLMYLDMQSIQRIALIRLSQESTGFSSAEKLLPTCVPYVAKKALQELQIMEFVEPVAHQPTLWRITPEGKKEANRQPQSTAKAILTMKEDASRFIFQAVMLSQMVASTIDSLGSLKGMHTAGMKLNQARNACHALVEYVDRYASEDLQEAIADHNYHLRGYILMLLDPNTGPDAMAILAAWKNGDVREEVQP